MVNPAPHFPVAAPLNEGGGGLLAMPAGEIRRVTSLVEAIARRFPDAVAVEHAQGVLTYAELMRTADHLASLLRDSGAGPGHRVAVRFDRGADLLVAVMAVLRSGAAYVPLDPAYPASRQALMLEAAEASVLLTHAGLGEPAPGFSGKVVRVDALPPAEATPGSRDADAVDDQSADALAYVIFTSGSTGLPKGVAMGHRALGNLIRWELDAIPVRSGERTLQFTSLSFDVSFQELFVTWSGGGTVVVVDDETRRDPSALWRFVQTRRITRLYLPFVALQQLAEAAAEAPPTASSLKNVITAGEQLQCTPALRSLFSRLPETRLHNHYGPSETHVVTAFTLPADVSRWPDLPPIGTPIRHVDCHLLDEDRRPVAAGEAGELYLGGRCLAHGYLGRPDLTAERFVILPDWPVPGARLYRTGDHCRQNADGQFEFLGRIDAQLKIRGHRVEPGEVEAALRRHPAVREAAVAGTSGEAAVRQLVAYVVPREPGRLDTTDLRSFLMERLAEPMVPSVFVSLDRLPLTPNGKVDRRALPAPPETPAPRGAGLVAPTGPTELAIARIWAGLLKLEQVGATESFFELGGTSLMLLQVRRQLQEVLRRDVAATELYRFPTVRALAAHLEDAGPTPADPGSGAQHRAALQKRAAQAAARPRPLAPRP